MSWYDSFKDKVLGSSEPDPGRAELDKKSPVSSGGVHRGKTPDEKIVRIPPTELEKLYYEDPLVHAGINFYTRQITGEEFTIIPTSGTSDNDLHRIREFVETTELRNKLGNAMRDMGIYGNAFMEIIWNKRGDKVKDLVPLDPKNMEFIKEKVKGKKKVATDEMGEPIGYIQKVGGMSSNKDIEKYNEIVSKFKGIQMKDIEVEKGIPFHRDQIVHFRLQKLSDTLMGIGLIEPVYDIVKMKMNVEDALEDGISRSSRPDLVGKVGTFQENEPVRAKDTEALKNNLEKMRSEEYGVISIPEYWDVDELDTDVKGLDEYYQIYNDLTIVGMGLPPGMLSRGSGVTSGIAEIQNALSEKVFQTFQNSITLDCRRQIFTTILEEDDLNKVPQLEWKELNPLTKGKKARRIAELARAGLITRDRELEQHIRELEGLPPLPEESEEERKEREKR
ncbi:MAG: phage portal protein, partial [Candidatus Aenigmatarchaeota archaeon]